MMATNPNESWESHANHAARKPSCVHLLGGDVRGNNLEVTASTD